MPKEHQLQLEFTKQAQDQNKLTVAKIELKKLLEDHQEYVNLTEKKQDINIKLGMILQAVAQENPKLIEQIESLKAHIKNDKELLSDLAVNKLIAGEMIEVRDDDGNLLAPIFTVKFKKI